MSNPRIYVACLASYNNGVLHGRWIDLYATDLDDLDDVQSEIAAMLRESPYPNVVVQCPVCAGERDFVSLTTGQALPCERCKGTGRVPSAEEWAVHDSEDLPAGFRDTEQPDLAALVVRLQELEDLSDDEREAFNAFCEVEGDESVDTFRERYIGEFNSWADLAEHCVEEGGLLQDAPDALARYFDFEAYGRDMHLGGEFYEHRGHFFRSV